MQESTGMQPEFEESTAKMRTVAQDTVHSVTMPRISANKLITGTDSSSWAYRAGDVVGDCGINAVAMQLKWYDLYVNSNYLSSSYFTETQIKNGIYNYCIDNAYPTSLWEVDFATVLTGFSQKAGVGGTYLYADYLIPDWALITKTANSNRPLVASTSPRTPTYGTHYVISCGYLDIGDYTQNQIYVNDGWGGYAWINYGYLQGLVKTTG